MDGHEKIKRISMVIALISLAVIGFGAFIALGAFTREPIISSERTLYRFNRLSEYNLTYLLEPNEIYETEVIQQALSQPIYISLIKLLLINYTYSVSEGIARGGIRITIYLVHPDGWVKKYGERNIAIDSSRATVTIPLNINSTSDLMVRLSKQVMTRSDLYTIRITALADTNIYIGQHIRRDIMNHTIDLSVMIAANKISLEGNQTSIVNTYEEKTRITEVAKLIGGITVDTGRNIAIATTGAGVALLAASTILRIVTKKERREEEILENKYSGIIVEVARQTSLGIKQKKIYIPKAEELVKLARLLEKPILKECLSRDRCEYYIVDQDTIYMLKTEEMTHQEEKQS